MPDPSPSDRRAALPLLLLAALVAWQWVEAGGPPSMGGSPWGGVGFTAMVLGGVVILPASLWRQLRRPPSAPA